MEAFSRHKFGPFWPDAFQRGERAVKFRDFIKGVGIW